MEKLAKKSKYQDLIYPFEIRPLTMEDGGGYLISFPDIPGCISDGETPEEAIENGRDALWCILKVYKDEGKSFPKVASEYSGKFVQRVPKFIHAELETTAAREGVSMNSLVQSFISHSLGMSAVEQRISAKKPRVIKKTTKGKAKNKKA